jgi:ATP-dependent DNA ligase
MKDFKVMLAKPLRKSHITFPCLISPKLDGIRVQLYKGEFYTRNQKAVRGMTHLKKALLPMILEDINLDGELMVPDMPFQKSSGLIRNHQETPNAVFHVFDMPSREGIQEERIAAVGRHIAMLDSEFVKAVHHMHVYSMEDVMDTYTAYRDSGHEGAMLKNLKGLYLNKRSDNWMKMKEVITHDLQCVGYFEGMGRLSGTLGGIIVELDGVRVRVGGGFSDSDRDHIWRCRDQYRGCVCEVASQEVTPDGSLRHPRFITWRPDLEDTDTEPVSDCCGAPLFSDCDICPECKEHCGPRKGLSY